MSTSAYIHYDKDSESLLQTLEYLDLSLEPGDWKNIGNQIEISLSQDARTLTISTYFMGSNMSKVRELAMQCWELYGGSLALPEELRAPSSAKRMQWQNQS